MRYLFPIFLLLSACESDRARYDRLNTELVTAQLLVQADESRAAAGLAVCPEFSKLPTNLYLDSCNVRQLKHRTDLALATRDYNKFMGNK